MASLTNAAPGYGEGGSTGKGVMETQCSVGRAPDSLRSSPERPHQESPQALPPRDVSLLRHEFVDILPSTMNTVRGAATRTGQVTDLGRPSTLRRDTFEDTLADVEVPTTLQRHIWFANVAISTPIPKPI